MKRTYTLVVLLGLVIGALVTGCNNEAGSDANKGTVTNATTTTTTTSTNK